MSKKKLKPCPFCGGEAEIIDQSTLVYSGWMVFCKECNAITRNAPKKEAISAWNKRLWRRRI